MRVSVIDPDAGNPGVVPPWMRPDDPVIMDVVVPGIPSADKKEEASAEEAVV